MHLTLRHASPAELSAAVIGGSDYVVWMRLLGRAALCRHQVLCILTLFRFCSSGYNVFGGTYRVFALPW